ncbi:LCP family protein [Actinotalea sp. Marseille-Q4924]|uniref:LCP family protein n=1 Tax=Actinotalea sp. Marseille-Q4924 TaxID=2866571 RepID=UPI001CE46F4D|nr:LCP family protein [Actinotalea sp. Marseille-Q4924]
MSPRHVAPRRARSARHARTLRGHPLARGTALVAAAAVSFGATGAATAYVRIEGNIATADVTELLGERPVQMEPVDPDDPNAGQPLNILIMGSDVRDGENAEIGGSVEGMRSDTTILLHISADRERVEMISIPRDSHVEIPSCDRSDGTSSDPGETRFNEAFSIGSASGEVSDAAACTIRTVEALTGVYVHGWLVVDFAGFINMVDALGGIPMCIEQPLRSEKAGLNLGAGQQTLDGPTALAYARARTGEGLGDGSDIGRLGRQQRLLAATASEVLSKNILTDSAALYRFLTAATQSITTDPTLGNIPNLAGLAFSLRGIPAGNITFMTVPIAPYQADPNQVVWTDEADVVFDAIAEDRSVVEALAPPPAPPAEGEPAEPAEPADPAAPAEPAPAPTEEPTPGVDPFSPADIDPAVCG